MPGNYRSRTDHYVITNINRQYCRIRADRYPVADPGWLPFVFIPSGRASRRKGVVNEHDPVSYEAIFADGDQFANERMGLHFGAFPDTYGSLYLHEGAYKTIVPYGTTIEVDRLDDLYAGSEYYVFYLRLQDLGIIHKPILGVFLNRSGGYSYADGSLVYFFNDLHRLQAFE
jgi:hypothetical protein